MEKKISVTADPKQPVQAGAADKVFMSQQEKKANGTNSTISFSQQVAKDNSNSPNMNMTDLPDKSPQNNITVNNNKKDNLLQVGANVEESKNISTKANVAGSGYHGIDQRAQSQTFENQKKFWLEPSDLSNIYENKSTTYDKMERQRPPPGEIVFLQGGCKAYSSSKDLTAGQYIVPFSFKLPENIPGTFYMTHLANDGKEYPLRISYTVEMFLDTDNL